MRPPFTVYSDADGNLYMEAGPVNQVLVSGSSVPIWVGAGGIDMVGASGDGFRVAGGKGASFEGGNGTNVDLVPGSVLDGYTLVPYPKFKATGPDTWQNGALTVVLGGTGAVDLSDGGGVIAALPAGSCTIAPYGTLNSTPHGEAVYGGVPFTVDLDYEGAAGPWGSRQAFTAADVLTALESFFNRTGWQDWQGSADPSWTMVLGGTGAGLLHDGIQTVATRAADALRLYDPRGEWESTAYGEATYNGGIPFTVGVGLTRALPMAGAWYVRLLLDAGNEVTSAEGPIYAAAPPTNVALTEFYVPIAEVAGGQLRQIQSGPIYWKP